VHDPLLFTTKYVIFVQSVNLWHINERNYAFILNICKILNILVMDKSTGKAIVGFIFGAAVGVAAGILFAPRSGVETRKKLEKKAKEVTDDITNKVGEKIDQLKGHMDDFTREAKTRIKKATSEE